MTKTIITGYIAFLLMTFGFLGLSLVHASEVTGTLSSDASSNSSANGGLSGTVTSDTQTIGNISGTVTGGSSGGGSSGGRGNRSNGSSNDEPSGEVLGATTDTVVPGFPNAGLAPENERPAPTLWSKMVTFFSNIVFSKH